MARTFITTPVISPCLRALARFFAWLLRWKMPDTMPDLQKAVFIGAPHTSNWDFFIMLMAVLIWRVDAKWIGKHTLFRGPFGAVMRWLGGIPIDRTKRQNFVDQMVEHFNRNEKTILVIAPEGTRKPVERWHRGFYYMALNAHVPIVLAYVDYKKREVGIKAIEMPSGDADADIERYQKFYATVTGKNPHNYFGYPGEYQE